MVITTLYDMFFMTQLPINFSQTMSYVCRKTELLDDISLYTNIKVSHSNTTLRYLDTTSTTSSMHFSMYMHTNCRMYSNIIHEGLREKRVN